MKKVLICEDDQSIQELLKEFLSKNDCEVDSADNGKEAVSKAKSDNPELIILDIRMPKLNGLEVAAEIRKFNQQAKLVFLTGFQSPELRKEAQKYNISAYIVKSNSPKEVLRVIQGVLKD
ncbi:MAG: response regulator [Candidatus Omnitrophota bacterium]